MLHNELFIDKYKPVYFNDYENTNTEIIQLLQTMIQINNLNIIFIGKQGCGKTTIINTLIKEYYNYQDHSEESNTGYKTQTQTQNSNVLRINSLKEQGINYFRNDVKIFCQTSSTIKGKKKILVLDDIDTINEQIQQIFRNCIDKYSNNVHFICSCNNTQKVIENLQSRLTIIQLETLETSNILHIINKIIVNEKLSIDSDVIDFILSISNNCVNVILNYLEKFKILNSFALPSSSTPKTQQNHQCSNHDINSVSVIEMSEVQKGVDEKITLETAMNICTNINFVILKQYTELIKKGEESLHDAICLIYSIYDKGYSTIDILDTYFLFIKFTDILTETEKYEIIPIICKYISIFYNMNEDQIENALFTNELVQLFSVNSILHNTISVN
jgi:DNA polymerase III delta prime subunit